MRETSFTYRPWFDGRVATGQDEKGGPVPPVRRDSYLASDDIHTTAEDYARFLLSVMKREGISRGLAAQRETVQASTRPNFCAGEKEKACPREIGFGLGWEVHKYAGGTILFHTGADKGEFTLAFLNPETLTGTVVLTNARGSPPVILDILDRLEVDPELMRFLHSQAGY
jgi:CubicO group peptidase (beta-lactamase class C family)